MNAYNVPLVIFRNRIWNQTFILLDANGDPVDVSQNDLALVVFPVDLPSGNVPVLENTTPELSGTNTVTFVSSDAVTGTLTAGTMYQWQFLNRPPGTDSYVICAGPISVNDSPPFPGA